MLLNEHGSGKKTVSMESPLRWFKYVLPFLVAILIQYPTGCKREAPKEKRSLAPDFTLATIDGRIITVSQLKGKVVLLDFWATWCAPCRLAIPHLNDLYRAYRERGLEIIGLSLDKGNPGQVRRFAVNMGIKYPIIMADDDVVKNYGISPIPTTYLIDREGYISNKWVGFSQNLMTKIAAETERHLSKGSD
jgi:peroxiredoxin